ncbi:MAG: energy transducer TonB [Gammaproteobacteria bacterium]|nr:energy transducer TonB [Gammaproteobacteria bacterium]
MQSVNGDIAIRLTRFPTATPLLRLGLYLAMLIPCIAHAETAALEFPTDVDELVAALESQLEVGEFEDAAQQIESWLATQDRDGYDLSLAEPFMLLGDARMGMRDPVGAIEAYDRARHITRLSKGIQGIEQLPILYREADAFSALGDDATANDRQEFAFGISRREYGADDPRHMIGTYRLLHWYRHHYKYLAAHVLFEQLLEISREHLPAGDPLHLRMLREHAQLFRHRVFGRRTIGRGRFLATPPGLLPHRYRQNVSSFREGRNALAEVVEIQESNALASDGELATALLEYADWHLMFGDYPFAVRHYRRIWDLLASDPERRTRLFGQPTPLFLPLPSDPGYRLRRVGMHRDGIVHLALTVTHRGHVIGSKSLEVAPRSIMEFRVRKAAKRARFRPAFREGQPVKVRGHPLRYTYSY